MSTATRHASAGPPVPAAGPASRARLARAWWAALSATTTVPMSDRQVEDFPHGLLDRLVDALSRDPTTRVPRYQPVIRLNPTAPDAGQMVAAQAPPHWEHPGAVDPPHRPQLSWSAVSSTPGGRTGGARSAPTRPAVRRWPRRGPQPRSAGRWCRERPAQRP